MENNNIHCNPRLDFTKVFVAKKENTSKHSRLEEGVTAILFISGLSVFCITTAILMAHFNIQF